MLAIIIYGWHWAVFKIRPVFKIQPNHVLHLIKYDVYLYILVSHDQLTILFSSVWSSSACSASKVTFSYKQ